MPDCLRKIRGFILDVLFPIECLNCRREGDYLCEKCFHRIKFNDLAALASARQNLKTPSLEKIFIAGDYEDKLLRNLIKKYKYDFIKPLGEILARFLITFWNFQEEAKPNETKQNETKPNKIEQDKMKNKIPTDLLVIPIPLTAKRLRWRGFNQAEIIARDFSKYFAYKFNSDLKREGKQNTQASLNENDRLENIKNAFRWSGKNLEGKNILLIDDVVTTGATINEAAETLKKAGAGAIYGLVLAKG